MIAAKREVLNGWIVLKNNKLNAEAMTIERISLRASMRKNFVLFPIAIQEFFSTGLPFRFCQLLFYGEPYPCFQEGDAYALLPAASYYSLPW